jgi:ABC-type dipeptide/oligopeptide/nickel transport system ATPase component
MIFITHDLGLVADMADRALVMLRGRVVESGSVKEIFTNPQHPYTRGLLMCRPALHVKVNGFPLFPIFWKILRCDQIPEQFLHIR